MNSQISSKTQIVGFYKPDFSSFASDMLPDGFEGVFEEV
jgi:hypothetical protein